MSPRTIDIRPLEPTEHEGWLRLSARVEGLDRAREAIWFDVEPERRDALTDLADPFLLALIFPAMEVGARLHAHGAVSRALLERLETFQTVWRHWRPERYSPGALSANREVSGPARDGGSIVMFSGGLDSAFTLYRRARGLLGPRARNVAAALMVLGFDIPLEDADQFPAAAAASRRMTASLGLDLWTLRTNFRALTGQWEDAHATALAACLHLFSGRHGAGVIAASTFWRPLNQPWGSNPMTDPMLGSDRMAIVHDAGEIQRHLKPALVSEWPEAMAELRVCYQCPVRDRNCGECTKCLLTKLSFMAAGLPIPASLMPPPTHAEIMGLRLRSEWERATARLLLEHARANGQSTTTWRSSLEVCLMRNGSLWQKACSRLRRAAPRG